MKRWLWTTMALAVACAGAGSTARAADRAPRPNIIFVLADDMGYSDIGCYGGDVRTPNLDALAKEGVRFTAFFNNARCCPTRASILTGLYAHEAGMGGMSQKTDVAGYLGHLRADAPTIAEVLKTAGYHTAMFGKWHLANTPQGPEHLKDLNRQQYPATFAPIEQYPSHRGFDTYWGGIWGLENYFNPFSLVDGDKPVKDLPDDFYMTDAINAHATDYIAKTAKDTTPFFMYLAHNAPHWPLHARAEDIARYRDQYNDGWDAIRRARYVRMAAMGILDPKTAELPKTLGQGWDKLSPDMKRFQAGLFQTHAAMIDRMDQGLGQVFQALKDAGKWDSTLIVFLSDNGASPERYEDAGFDRPTLARDGKPIHYHYDDLNNLAGPEHTFYYIGRDWANVANTPYRKAKMSQYNGGDRTPLIAHWPAGLKVPAGSFIRQRGHVIDLMETALDVAGATLPDTFAGHTPHPLQGVSLLPLLKGEATIPNYPTLYGEHEGGRSVITPDGWKLIKDRGEDAWHLYDLDADQTETKDRIQDEPERAARMRAMWDQWAKDNQVLPKP